jgi:hypothetical protein
MELVKHNERSESVAAYAIFPQTMEDLGARGALAQTTTAEIEGCESCGKNEELAVVKVSNDRIWRVDGLWYHCWNVGCPMFALSCVHG